MERLILSVDRLDYSKGLRQRFAAFERFLAEFPAQHGLVTFMQIAPPSRTDIEAYQRIRRELEGEAGRINGRFAEVDWVPLRYLNRGFRTQRADAALCRSAGRSGHAAAGRHEPRRQGICGGPGSRGPRRADPVRIRRRARELDAALLVNPYDEAGMARAMDRALSMPVEERRERHQAMLTVMRANSLEQWRDRFEADLRNE